MNDTLRQGLKLAGPCVKHRADDWLSDEGEIDSAARPERSTEISLETLLAWNAGLAGGAKFVVSPDRRLCVRAELPQTEECALPDATAAITAGFEQARRLWRQGGVDMLPEPLPPAVAPPAQLLQTGAESGWEVHANADGTLVADLEDDSGHWQARLLPLPTTGTLIMVELAAINAGSAEAREAVALLLLLAGAALRWARPAVRTTDGRAVAVFEIPLPIAPTPASTAEALSALSVACRLVGNEVSVLLHEPAAHDYLQVMGPISVPTANSKGKKNNHGPDKYP